MKINEGLRLIINTFLVFVFYSFQSHALAQILPVYLNKYYRLSRTPKIGLRSWDIRVTNTDSSTVVLEDGFTVYPKPK
jgi:hypothetical protein